MPGKHFPRPPGIADLNGAIPLQWYERIFETEVRLGLNMVAPYTRARRSRLVNELASDYGMILTSHHYDALLSNPWGFRRHGLAREQGVEPVWNYLTNKDGMVEYLSNAVKDLNDLETVWVIGVRGDRDKGYRWPKGTTDEQIMQFNSDTMELQKQIVRDITGTDPDFAMTSWAEVNEKRERGLFQLKNDTIMVWADFRRAGVMVDLPKEGDTGRHGVYYHLAITMGDGYATSVGAVVSEDLLVDQWRAIFDAGATEYLLVNISEVREFIREGRMLTQIAQHGHELLDLPDPAADFRDWFSKEYFGKAAASKVSSAYEERFDIALYAQELYAGNTSCLAALDEMEARLHGPSERKATIYPYLDLYTDNAFDVTKARAMMDDIIARSDRVLAVMSAAKELMNEEQARYFDENAVLPMMMVNKPAKASLILFDALEEQSDESMITTARRALEPLEEFEAQIKLAERPPFERWYEASAFRHSYPEIDPRTAHIRLRMLLDGKLFYRR